MSGVHVVIAASATSRVVAVLPPNVSASGVGLVQTSPFALTATGGSGSYSVNWNVTFGVTLVKLSDYNVYVEGYPVPGEPLVATVTATVTDLVTGEVAESNTCFVVLTSDA